MALITRKAYAEKCNIPTNQLSVLLKRGQVVADGDMIDTNHPKNVAYYNNREAKGLLTKKPASVKKGVIKHDTPKKPKPGKLKTEPTDDETDDEDVPGEWNGKGVMPLAHSERIYKHELAMKTRTDKELSQLKVEKLNAMLIPTDLVKMLFLNFSKSVAKSVQEQMQNFMNLIIAKHKIPPAEAKKYLADMLEFLNKANDKAVAGTKADLGKIVDQYSLSKGRGEK